LKILIKILTNQYQLIQSLSIGELARRIVAESTEPAGLALASSIAPKSGERISGWVQAPLIAVNSLSPNILAVTIC